MELETGDAKLSGDDLKSFHLGMLRIRRFEERVAELLVEGHIKCPTHLYIGQEAIAVGVCAALKKSDYVWGTHRSHGHYLAKGGDMKLMMAELFCKATGCSRGMGGSMHLFAREVGILGTVPMVSATIPIAVGAALSSRMSGNGKVSVAFFGDGAVEEGSFHESMNFASLKKLPVVFVCENNLYASHLPLEARQPRGSIYEFGEAHSMPGFNIDGNDVTEVYEVAKDAIGRARAGEGPSLIECRTYRWRGHVGPNWDLDVGPKRRSEIEEWQAKCPIKALEQRLFKEGVLTDDERKQIVAKVEREVEDSYVFAKESPLPDVSELTQNVFRA